MATVLSVVAGAGNRRLLQRGMYGTSQKKKEKAVGAIEQEMQKTVGWPVGRSIGRAGKESARDSMWWVYYYFVLFFLSSRAGGGYANEG